MFCCGERVYGLRPGAGLLAHLRELEYATLGQRLVGLHPLQQPLCALVQAQLEGGTGETELSSVVNRQSRVASRLALSLTKTRAMRSESARMNF